MIDESLLMGIPDHITYFTHLTRSRLISEQSDHYKSGNVLGMGKVFHYSRVLVGQDHGKMTTKARQRAVNAPSNAFSSRSDANVITLQKLNIRLTAIIINDSASVLLASAHVDPPHTRVATTLGTGLKASNETSPKPQ